MSSEPVSDQELAEAWFGTSTLCELVEKFKLKEPVIKDRWMRLKWKGIIPRKKRSHVRRGHLCAKNIGVLESKDCKITTRCKGKTDELLERLHKFHPGRDKCVADTVVLKSYVPTRFERG